MIVINCALKQNEIIEVVEKISINGKNPFKYREKKGIKIFFDSTEQDNVKNLDLIKSSIKKSEFGTALFFNISEEV